jgi:hypothetical protein
LRVFVDARTTIEAAETIRRDVEAAVYSAVPEAWAVTWAPRAWLESA